MSSQRPVKAPPRLSALPPEGMFRDLKEVRPSLSSDRDENMSYRVLCDCVRLRAVIKGEEIKKYKSTSKKCMNLLLLFCKKNILSYDII